MSNKEIKISIAFIAYMFTSYLLIHGFVNPDVIGYVKDHSGANIQPDTTIIQISGWVLMAVIHFAILFYLIYNINFDEHK